MMTDNISGTFQLEIKGELRDLKCSFGLIERLEGVLLKRPIMVVLNYALNGQVYFSDIVTVIHEGLKANRDTRFTREEIGQEVLENGMTNYVAFYIMFLTYAISGKTEIETEPSDKKK